MYKSSTQFSFPYSIMYLIRYYLDLIRIIFLFLTLNDYEAVKSVYKYTNLLKFSTQFFKFLFALYFYVAKLNDLLKFTDVLSGIYTKSWVTLFYAKFNMQKTIFSKFEKAKKFINSSERQKKPTKKLSVIGSSFKNMTYLHCNIFSLKKITKVVKAEKLRRFLIGFFITNRLNWIGYGFSKGYTIQEALSKGLSSIKFLSISNLITFYSAIYSFKHIYLKTIFNSKNNQTNVGVAYKLILLNLLNVRMGLSRLYLKLSSSNHLHLFLRIFSNLYTPAEYDTLITPSPSVFNIFLNYNLLNL